MRLSRTGFVVICGLLVSACGGGGGDAPAPTPPRATAGSITLDEDTDGSGTMTGVAGEGGTLSFSVRTQPTDGVLSASGADFTYTPDPDFNGTDSFTFVATESGRTSQPATFTLNVSPVNDAPTSTDSTLSTDEDSPLLESVVASDVDGDSLTLTITTPAANGTVTPDTNLAFTYTPAVDFFGQDTFTFTVSDGVESSADATVTIDVAPINDPPVVADITDTVVAGTPVSYDLTGTDVENDALTYTVTGAFQKATVTNDPTTTGQLDVTPNYGEWGADVATYVANDGQADSTPASIDIDIEVPATSGAITFEMYDAFGQAKALSVAAGDGETVYAIGNVFGDFSPGSMDLTQQQFVAVYDASAGARVKEVYLGGNRLAAIVSGFVDNRLVAAGWEVDTPTTVRVMTLDANDDADVDATVTVPYAITRANQRLEPVHVPDVGFFVLGNDNQLSVVDYDGVLQSTVAIPSPISTIVQQYQVQDVRVIGGEVYLSGSIFECADASDQCFSGVGNLGFMLTATTAGAVLSMTALTTDFPDASAILDDGRVAAQVNETLYFVDVDGTELWQRSVPGAAFGDILYGNVGVDAAGDVYWFSYNQTNDNAHAERVSVDNATIWETDQVVGLVDFFWPNGMVVDSYGNMFVTMTDRYNDMGSAFGRVVSMHFDYSGDHQWTESSEPSDMGPNTRTATKTILTPGYRLAWIGNDEINAGGSDKEAFLFINTITPAPP